jgi:hypothetical protein
MRIVIILLGLSLAAVGGVVAYRAAFIEPSVAIVLTDSEVREVSNVPRIIGGTVLLLLGASVAFLAARRRRR